MEKSPTSSTSNTNIQDVVNKTKKYIDAHLLPIIQSIGEQLEGNIFYYYTTDFIYPNYIQKQHNLVEIIQRLSSDRNLEEKIDVFEIGFNSGFSALLFLFASPNVYIKCVDLGFHRYTWPCFEKIRETFGNRIQLILGDSTEILPHIRDTFDVIHIDGGHTVEIAENDIFNVCRFVRDTSIFIMDDTQIPELADVFQKYDNWMKMEPFFDEKTNYHTIRKYERKPLISKKSSSITKIPKKIFQFLPNSYIITDKVQKHIDNLKKEHPNFDYQLFFLEEAREFIRDNFEAKVLNAFDSIVPITFKSDLWRYCILYKYGGIYLDFKYECTNGFNLGSFLSNYVDSDEIFVLDVNKTSLYTELIASKPNNMIFLHCINHIVKNVHERFYGNNDLDITGPGVLTSSVSENKKQKIELNHICINYNKYILWKGVPILKVFTEYSKSLENNISQPKTHYQYWRDRELYI